MAIASAVKDAGLPGKIARTDQTNEISQTPAVLMYLSSVLVEGLPGCPVSTMGLLHWPKVDALCVQHQWEDCTTDMQHGIAVQQSLNNICEPSGQNNRVRRALPRSSPCTRALVGNGPGRR